MTATSCILTDRDPLMQVPSATPMQVGQTKSRVQKKKKKATKEKSWSMLTRKHAEQVQMES